MNSVYAGWYIEEGCWAFSRKKLEKNR